MLLARTSILAILLLAWSTSSLAANFTVTKLADTNDGSCDADCSLREAIIEANSLGGADQINLPAGVIVLAIGGIDEDLAAQGDLDILDSVDILGSASQGTVIDGNQLDRVFQVSGMSIVVTFENLTVQNGLVDSSAGGILVSRADLTLRNVLVAENAASQGLPGGGLKAQTFASVTLDSSTIANNFPGNVSIIQSDFVATNSTISTGGTTSSGPGIQVTSGATADFTNATLVGTPGTSPTLIARDPSTVTVRDSIIDGSCIIDAGVVWTSEGGNVESPGLSPSGSACELDQVSDQIVPDAGLFTLGMHGGPTPTHGLVPGSPAIGGAASCPPPIVDQRGEPRTDGACDSGSLEVQSTDDFDTIFVDGFESGDTSSWSDTVP